MKNRAVSFFTSGSLVIGSAVLFLGAAAFAAIVSGTSTTNISAHVTYTQLTINKPTVSVGDVMVASIAVLDGSIGNVTAPTGWTQIARTDNDVNVTLISYWKVANASEPSTYTWAIDEQTKAVGGITPYTGVDTTNPIDVVAGNTGFGATATTSAVTTSGTNEEVIALFATDVSKTFSTPTGMTEKFDLSHTAAGPSTAADDAIQTPAGTVSSKSSTITGNKARNWSSQLIALRTPPAVAVFDSTGTWTVPAGVTLVTVDTWGAGGGGDGQGEIGGGAGAYVHRTNVPVTPGNTYTVTIGVGGTGGSGSSSAGTGGAGEAAGGNGSVYGPDAGGGGGGSSSFTNDSTKIIAAGGAGGGWLGNTAPSGTSGGSGDSGYPAGEGGGGGAGTAGGNASGTTGGAGGTGASTLTGTPGIGNNAGGGSSAGSSGNGNNSNGFNGGSGGAGSGGAAGGSNGIFPTAGANGSGTDSGGGGGGITSGSNNAGIGGQPGSGGGGANAGLGGNGGDGRLVLTY